MHHTRPDEIQNDKLLEEYSALALDYDHRWVAYLDGSLRLTLGKISDLPAERVLDVACGTGQLLDILASKNDYSELVGIDKVPAMLDVARRRLGVRATLLQCDAAQLPFVDEYFQLVTSTNALHYFTNADTTLREIRRVVSPNGNLVITDWCRNFVWMKLLHRILPVTRHAHAHTFNVDELEHEF